MILSMLRIDSVMISGCTQIMRAKPGRGDGVHPPSDAGSGKFTVAGIVWPYVRMMELRYGLVTEHAEMAGSLLFYTPKMS